MSRQNHTVNARSGRKMSRRVGLSMLAAAGLVASLAVAAEYWRNNAVRIDVEVRGGAMVSADDVIRAAGVPDSATLADVALLDVRMRVEKLPAVREAVVFRDPPATLVIEIRERKPVALLANVNARDWLLDREGVALPLSEVVETHKLILITGGHAVRSAAPGRRIDNSRLQQALRILVKAQDIGADYLDLFSEIALEGKSDFLLYTLVGGIPVLLPGDRDPRRALRAFRVWWETIAVPRAVDDVEYVDLRYRDQLVVKWKNAQIDTATLIDTTGIIQD